MEADPSSTALRRDAAFQVQGDATPGIAPRALEHELALAAAAAVTVRRRSGSRSGATGTSATINPATGGATGGAWPPVAKRLRLSEAGMTPGARRDSGAVPGIPSHQALLRATPAVQPRGGEEAAGTSVMHELRPEGFLSTYEVSKLFIFNFNLSGIASCSQKCILSQRPSSIHYFKLF